MKCPSCDGSGSAFLDVDSKLYGEISIHQHCGECAGTGSGEVAEAARGIHNIWWHTPKTGTGAKEAAWRRAQIARYVASAMSAERTGR